MIVAETLEAACTQCIPDDETDRDTDDGRGGGEEACAWDVPKSETDQGTDDGLESLMDDWLDELPSEKPQVLPPSVCLYA